MIVFPNCKINLGLQILRKRADGYHDLATVFYPVQLLDALEVIQDATGAADVTLSLSGLPVKGDLSDNICVKAYRILKKDFQKLPPVRMHLHKTIPSGAGLGGGSADGAFTLLALNQKFRLELDEDQLVQYALELGSDCPFFIPNKPCFATGRGEIMEPIALDLSSYQVLLVNPGIHINTGWAFSQLRPDASKPDLRSIIQQPIDTWKNDLVNDFEEAVFTSHPEVGQLKEYIYAKGALYASMSGSGSTVFGIFSNDIKIQKDFPEHYFIHIM